jgi:hypothetical protein
LSRANRRSYVLTDTQPFTEEEIQNLPVAHRYSS